MPEPAQPGDSPVLWDANGQPRSRLFGDVYFSAADGLAESRAVFLEGCGLPQAWRGRRRFVVGELGFGTGLNIAALLDLWRRTRGPEARLQVFTVEAYPLSAAEAARALGAWPELAPVVRPLIARWPGRARGFHRLDLPEFGALVEVAVMPADEALAAWSGRADAWFLDGFAPAVNPQMWREELLARVAARSAPGARAASFTVAGSVRRALAAAGFAVAKRPGFGRKRERLEARLAGAAPAERPPQRVAVVGAGVAGVAAARALEALGAEAAVFDAVGLAAGGSGNPAALVTPRLDAGLGPPAELFAQAFRRAVRLYEAIPGAIIARGVLQLAANSRDLGRFAKIAASDLFEPGTLQVLTAEAASGRLGEPAPAALLQAAALVIEPRAALAAWAPPVRRAAVAALEPRPDGWRLRDAAGRELATAEAVIVAAAQASTRLAPGLPLRAVRGQASWLIGHAAPGAAAAWGGYVLPMREGVLFGATHDRDDEDEAVRPIEHERNLAILAAALPRFAAGIGAESLEGRASVRATTPDRLPLAGPAPGAPAGLFVLTGFGSRGFCHAPLLAEHVATLALAAASPLPAALAELVDPDRFARRAERRAGL